QFADSWMLLAMTLFFVGMVFWTFRPGSRAKHDDISRIPLRNEEPADDRGDDCAGGCPDCARGGACKSIDFGALR
ncbi:MAG: cbb3-type cytochrome c oxidase subunit 3, partial [Pseudomonadota bacterium]